MDKVEKFFELKQQWKAASCEQRKPIDANIQALLDSMTEEEGQALEEAVSADLKQLRANIEEVKEIAIKEKLSGILPLISVSHLARKYFNHSPQWFYQRLNGNLVNGKPAKFTENELKILADSLKEISQIISNTSSLIIVQ